MRPTRGASLAIVLVSCGIIVAAVAAAPDMVLKASSAQYLPHAYCLLLDRRLIALHVISDCLIALSYLAISSTLFFLCRKTEVSLPYRWMVGAFGMFVLACGFTHALDVVVLWHPLYWLLGDAKFVTAFLSIFAAVSLPLLVPRFGALFKAARTSRRNESRFVASASSSLDALFMLDAVRDSSEELVDFRFVYLNSKAQEMLILPLNELLGGSLCELFPINRTDGFFARYKEVLSTGKPSIAEFCLNDETINASWLRHQVVRMEGEDGIAITASDITDQKNTENRIRYMAHHDALTGLPNRSLLQDRLEQSIERANRYKTQIAVFVLDLNGFKEINDTHGHGAGDAVLQGVAASLRGSVRGTDSVFRLGGDEFVVLMGEFAGRDLCLSFTDKLTENVTQPIAWKDTHLQVTASIGLAIYPDDGTTPGDLLTKADNAMYRAKWLDRLQRTAKHDDEAGRPVLVSSPGLPPS